MANFEVKDGVAVIPEGTTEIGAYAFEGCKDLTSIVIPDSVKDIYQYAFNGCTSLTSIVIPAATSNIFYEIQNPFAGCSGLTSIKVSEGNKYYDSRNDCNAIIDTANNVLLSGCSTTVIPDSVTEIGGFAFDGCTKLTNIVIPDSVTKIGRNSFARSGLKEITIPRTVKKIDCSAYQQPFEKCNELKSITILCPIIIGRLFYDCPALETITLGTGIKKIDAANFKGLNLKVINVPAKKADYYKQRLPEELHKLIVELPAEKKTKN